MLGKRLRYLREKHNLSQLALAKKLGIPNQNISNYEREFRHPDYDTLQKIADFFEVSIDWLLGRTDDPSPPEKEIQFTFKGKPLDDELRELLTIILERLEKADEGERRFYVRMLRRIMADEPPGDIRRDLEERDKK